MIHHTYYMYPFLKERNNDSISDYYWVDHDYDSFSPKIGRMIGSYYLYGNPNYKVLKYEIYNVYNVSKSRNMIYKQPERIGCIHLCPKLGYINIYAYEGDRLLAQRKLMSINDIPLKEFISQDTCITPFCHFGE